MSAEHALEHERWDLEIARVTHEIRVTEAVADLSDALKVKKADVTSEIMVAEAIVSLAASLKAKGVKAPFGMQANAIYWRRKGWITAFWREGVVSFSWRENYGVDVPFKSPADAIECVLKIIGKRKTRSKRAKKEGV